MKRAFDLAICSITLLVLLIPFVIIYVMVKLTSKGPALHWSKRIGIHNEIFLMPKFRSMRIDTPQVATHLLSNADSYLTPIGSFLRKTSLDELPQILSVMKGDMSFVGPRPALFNQYDLIELRSKYGVDQLRPGITGWAQVNGRDELSIPVKVEFDKYYKENLSLLLDIKILAMTFLKVVRRDNVSH